MKNIKIFILHGCPYCHNAMKAWKELTAQEAYLGPGNDCRMDL
ncbi:hypothetical protein [Allisonella histaminiformans]|nr:hypothetical protein [Allisonella histaminiformans]